MSDKLYEAFLEELLQGKRRECTKIIQSLVDDGLTLKEVYFQYLERAMYEVGKKWEKNEISVANEHMATAIVEGVMNQVFPFFDEAEASKGKKIILACTSEEYHQIGAKMIADLFENCGWESYFVGANTPKEELVSILKEKSADLLGLSLSIHFNLQQLEETITHVNNELPSLKIIIGGQAINDLNDGFKEKFQNLRLLKSKEEILEVINE